MMNLKEKIEDIVWNIKVFIKQPIIPKKSVDWIIANDCSYNGKDNKYAYYWYGDFKTGYQVKISIEENKEWVGGDD